MKLHLTARAPNEGARLLARWVANRHGGDLDRASEKLPVDGMALQRIIGGEITPGLLIGASLAKHAGVRARDFSAEPRGGWFEDIDAAADRRAA